MRGEYYLQMRGEWEQTELPPRARRIPSDGGVVRGGEGTTSACAENTRLAAVLFCHYRNYLRVRGEYIGLFVWWFCRVELPPRARRILLDPSDKGHTEGTTSACAENTLTTTAPWHPRGNYLRVRGEYNQVKPSFWSSSELPPRARRILSNPHARGAVLGTTSACAENTPMPGSLAMPCRNYLRVRGEYPGPTPPRR